MAGDTENAALWAEADVWIALNLAATNPTDVEDPFGGDWDLVGLLDGEAGFVESRSEDTNDFYAWGGILVRTSRRNFKMTRQFTALETNPTVRQLVYPGSTGTEIIVPQRSPFKIGFETREGTKTRRVISRRYAEVDEVGDITESEADLKKYEITVAIYPDANGVLFDVQPDDDLVTSS